MGFVERPQLVWWRKTIFQVHLWTGAVIGLYVIAICVSGSVLVFQRDLIYDCPKLPPAPKNASRFTYEQIAQAAMNAHPKEPLDSIDMRTGDRRVVAVTLKAGDKHRVMYFDAYSSRVVAEAVTEDKHPVMSFLEPLHNELLGNRTGAIFNGVGGAFLFLMCPTGMILWWPGRKNWKRALKVKWNARGPRLNFDLHSAFGFWTVLFIGMWGLTGAYFIFPQQFNNAFGLLSSTGGLQSQWMPKQRMLGLDVFLNKAWRLYPNSKLAYLYMDVYRPHGQVTVFLSRDPSVPLTLLEDIVRFDPGNGQIVDDESSAKWSIPEKIALGSYSVHFGDFGGVASKIVWAFLGLVPAGMVVTGYLMWWNRSLKKKWAALRRAGTHQNRTIASSVKA